MITIITLNQLTRKKKSNIKQTKKSMGLEVKIISSNIPPNCKAFIQRQEMIKP